MKRRVFACAALLLAAAAPAAAALDAARAVRVTDVTLDWGMGTLHLAEGVLVPAAGGAPADSELVFVGQGTLRATPPDAIEAGQLELFTGSTELDAAVTAAVLVMPRGGDRVLARGRGAATAEALADAARVWEGWRTGPYRTLLGVDATLFAAALEDRWGRAAFAGWFRAEGLGELVAVLDPYASEQVTLGQFVPLELSKREAREASRLLHREQRQGRLLGLSVEQLGQFDTWMSASLLREGQPRPGFTPLEAVHHAVEVALGDPEEMLRGRAVVTLRSLAAGEQPRAVTLRLAGDLVVATVTQDGTPCRFLRTGDELTIALATPPAAGGDVELTVEYAGKLLAPAGSGDFPLRDTVFWHPRGETLLPASWDVRLEWPAKLDLVASGERVEGGEQAGRRWERRRLAAPAFGFTFELGDFERVSAAEGAAPVPVHLHLDHQGQRMAKADRKQIVDTAAEALAFFAATFGPYPHGELHLVTGGRDYSQSMPGVVTLSNLMMADFGALGVLLGLEDRRTVVAHEVAHQWWGHQVGWSGYRDVWISEAVANFAALAYARAKLDPTKVVGPTFGWQVALASELPDGRTVEAVGPLVLGPRLLSSKSEGAYEPIVYRKGAVVLDMLTQRFGEEGFLAMLREVVTAARGKVLTTDVFLAMLERLGDSDLDPFADRFVRGTGWPEVYYQASFERREAGGWRIAGEARQMVPGRFRYRAVRNGERWDVARERVTTSEAGVEVVVPLRIPVVLADKPAPKRGEDANGWVDGRLLLTGERTAIAFDLEHEPRELWLDPERRVLARFFNARRAPKRTALFEGAELVAAGKRDQGEQRLREALRLPVALQEEEGRSERAVRGEQRLLDARIRLELARLAFDRGDDSAAVGELRQARQEIDALSPWRSELEVLELRGRVRAGALEEAARGLAKAVLRRGKLDSTEAYVLLAIAAHQTGRSADLVRAREVASERGADLSALD